jgi:hypothetical protein
MTQTFESWPTESPSSQKPSDTGRKSPDSVSWFMSLARPSVTQRLKCPEENLFVTIDYTGSKILRVQAYAGKHGTEGFTNAQALSELCTLALDAGAQPIQVVWALRGFSHEDTNSIAFEADSIPDGIGRAINDFIASREQDSGDTA